jgi:hypothetical protein
VSSPKTGNCALYQKKISAVEQGCIQKRPSGISVCQPLQYLLTLVSCSVFSYEDSRKQEVPDDTESTDEGDNYVQYSSV